MRNSQQDNERNTQTLGLMARDTAQRAKRSLKHAAERAQAAVVACQAKAERSAGIGLNKAVAMGGLCKDKAKVLAAKAKAAAGVCQHKAQAVADKAQETAGLCRDKAQLALRFCQEKALVAARPCKAKALAAFHFCQAKALVVARPCKAKALVAFRFCQAKALVMARPCKAKALVAFRFCQAKALVAARPCKAKALVALRFCQAKALVVARPCKAKALEVIKPCAAKLHAVSLMCREKAQLASTACQDILLVARVDAGKRLRARWEKTCAQGQQVWEQAGILAQQMRVRVDRHPVSPLLYITLLTVCIGTISFNGMYTKAYVAYVDGHEVGVVANAEELNDIVGNVENRVSNVLGEEYSYDTEITLTATYLNAGTQTNARAIEDALFEDTGALMNAYAISVDGQELGYAQTSQELEEMLEAVAQPYLTEQTLEHHFLQDVEIYPVEVPSNTQFTPEALQATLSGNKEEAKYVTVERGDTFNGIAQDAGLTGDQLQQLNPQADSSRLIVGDELLVQAATPMLTVETVHTVTYEETIQSPVEYVDNPDLYKGTTRLKSAGQDGVEQIEARVTQHNGVEIQREEVSRTTVQEATTTYMYKGTKEKPVTASTGVFKWPLYGVITSRFGYRNIFGGTSFHSGLDIAAPYGTQISAADGGTVTFAGWRNSYGYTVIITHDSGIVTYYAHCSSLLVNAGDKVYQGQAIARVGMTGTATGYHCHFEVRVGGRSVNPENYL